MLDVVIASPGVLITLIGVGIYIVEIMRGRTRPRMASWIAWGTANIVFTVVASREEAHLAAWINGISAVTNIVVIVVSLIKGVRLKLSDWIDWACLALSVACVVATVASPVKEIGALFAVAANLAATIPTLLHAWAKPREEAWPLFAANAVAGSLGVVGIAMTSGLEFASIAGPLIMGAANAFLVLITLGRRWRVVKKTPQTPLEPKREEVVTAG